MTAWTVPRSLVPAQRAQVTRLVVAMRAGDRQARATVEAMLPAAHQILHEHYDRAPVGAGTATHTRSCTCSTDTARRADVRRGRDGPVTR